MKKQEEKRYLTFRKRVIVILTVSVFTTLLFQGIVQFGSIYGIVQESTYNSIDATTASIATSLDQSFHLIDNMALQLSAGNAVKSWINDMDYYNEKNPEFQQRKNALNMEFQRILMYSSANELGIVEYAAIYNTGQMLGYTEMRPNSIVNVLEECNTVYETVVQSRDDYIYNAPLVLDKRLIFNIRKVKSDFTKKDQLDILIATNEKDVRKKYSDLLVDDRFIVYLTDKHNQILSSNREEEIGMKLSSVLLNYPENSAEVTVGRKAYLMVTHKLKKSEMELIYLYPKEVLMQQVFKGMHPFCLVSVSLFACYVIAGILLAVHFSRFLDEFEYAIQCVKEKNYDVRIKKYKNEAIDGLGAAFNEMTSDIKELIQNKYESQLLMNEMEISFLQQQIEPHFLFNVLLTMQIRAKRDGNEKLYKMIFALSSLLRASIATREAKWITIAEELKYTEFYLYLQQMRFEDKFTYRILVESEELKQHQVPKFIIEPIVENAVIHGIEHIEKEGLVDIRIIHEQEDLLITVSDNGVGFDVRKNFLDKKETEATTATEGRKEHIGMKNVDLRIKRIYGEKYGLTIMSEIHKGTVVQVRIPLAGRDGNV